MDALPLPGFESDRDVPRLIAHVYVDSDLPHLDYPLDYLVPVQWESTDLAGFIVQVPLAGRKRIGWVVSCERRSDISAAIREIIDVVSTISVVSPKTFELAAYVGKRFLSTASTVLGIAVPPRRARVEEEAMRSEPTQLKAAQGDPWEAFELGHAFLGHVSQGEYPRAVWTSIPGRSEFEIAHLISSVQKAGKTALIVVPTSRVAGELSSSLSAIFDVLIPVYSTEQTASERYRLYLQAKMGGHRAIVGTRSAVWLPMKDLGLIVLWGDGDDHLREARAPRTDALDVAVARSHLEHVALAVGSYSRSVKAQYLVERSWAISLTPQREVLRASTGRFVVADSFDQERQGKSAFTYLPPDAFSCIRTGLKEGPVLVLSAHSGYIPVVGCSRCARPARCEYCSGPLHLEADHSIVCSWCERTTENWSCLKCQGTSLKWWRLGSERIGEEIGRSFPQIPLTVARADDESRPSVGPEARIVVATPGVEPKAQDGYAAVIIPSAAALASRPEMWAPEEALRRWLNAGALARPHGRIWVSAGVEHALAQALIRWSPEDYIQQLLDERKVLRFPPTASIVAIDGPLDQVNAFCQDLPAELIGIVDAPSVGKIGHRPDDRRALIRCATADYPQLAQVLRERNGVRSARKRYPLRLTLNPPELF
ncbi:primosomal protein [uncultured Actinomyces sp.]|uniref:primosomal protein N' family DNA-binding protein n=1 Tax=uncultured Actinomyces sp. TaxID=249061 RepID=UPI0028D62FE4|nr:primosomal protein [uncultured Actinomyces sp.]